MTIKYVLTEDDLLHYYRYTLGKQFRMPFGLAFTCGVLLATVGFLGAMGYSNGSSNSRFLNEFLFTGLAFWGTTIAWSCSASRLKIILQNKVQKVSGLFTETTVDIRPEWLIVSSIYGEGRLKWQGVDQVTSDARCLYIVTGDLSHIIPKSAFVSAAEAQAFLESATEYWLIAKHMPLEVTDGVWPPPPRPGA